MNFFSKIIFCASFAVLFFPQNPAAQIPTDLKKNGEKYFSNRRWQDAAMAFGQYQLQKPGNEEVLVKLGICHFQLHDAEKARQYLEYVLNQNPKADDPDLFYYLARTLHAQSEWQKAIVFYKNYLKNAPAKHVFRANAVDNIKRCVAGMAVLENPAVALVENLGDRVNSSGDDFAPVPSVNHADRLYFSSARIGCTGGQRTDEGLEDAFAGLWRSDIYFANLETSGWNFAENLGTLLNTPREEVALDFDGNGRVLYFFRGFSQFSGEIFADTSGKNDEFAVQPPTFQSPFQPEMGDQSPYFFNDSTLIFASRRDGGQGGLDLWWTRRQGGIWAVPENLGAAVNSDYDETTPFLAADGRSLFFSSNRLESIGGLDVFSSVFDDSKLVWSPPQNFGRPVNSPGDDAFFRFSKDGKAAYFSSDRLESLGQRDIFITYFKEEQAAATQKSNPAFFGDVGKIAPDENENVVAAPSNLVSLAPFFYENDRELTGAANQKIVRDLAAAVRNFPLVKVVVIVHTDETGPSKFDLYYGIKRAEIVGKSLVAEGVPAERIVLRSVGSAYPMAKNVLGQETNPVGQRLNRRVEFRAVVPTGKSPIELETEWPEVAEVMASESADLFREKTSGLTFRVQVAMMRQILTDDALAMFEDMQIESAPGLGEYKYMAGFLKKFADAVALKKELVGQGFPAAQVQAYIDGVNISRAAAVGLVKKFPELAAFLKG